MVDLHNLGGDYLEIDMDRKVSTRILLAPKRCSHKEGQAGCAERVSWNEASDFVSFYIFIGERKVDVQLDLAAAA